MSKTKKCFSKCRRLPKDECIDKPRLCKYTNGKTFKYCKLSKNYALDKNCNMTRKKRKQTKDEAAKTITKFMKKNITKKIANELAEKMEIFKRKMEEKRPIKAAEKIGKFMKQTELKRKSHFLKTVCSDSGACIAVGTEIKKINEFFNHYTDFKYAVSPIKSIGAPSANGFIKEIKYTRDGYNSYAILKSSTRGSADNLMYEYEVGQYINKQNKVFSCFLETYGMFSYDNEATWKHFKDTKSNNITIFKENTTLIPHINYIKGCGDSKYIAILIQHVNKAITLYDFILNTSKESDKNKREYEINMDVFYILYQIYFTLDALKNEFTHYDLHASNVLLYEPVKGGYITYHYHLNSGKIIEFQSKYIAKIIDYGRCYYKDSAKKNSKNTYKNICSIKECEPNCGEKAGFMNLSPEEYPGSYHYISSQVHNRSHDLRLAYVVKHYLELINPGEIFPLFKIILDLIEYKENYGTPEKIKNRYPTKISNVHDMCKMLEFLINQPQIKQMNVAYNSSFTKIGDMHIYEDRRPMNYVKYVAP
jgi:hypothetical protein